MSRLAPQPLQLTESEREQLTQIVNRHSTPQQIGRFPAKILPFDSAQGSSWLSGVADGG